MGNTRKTYQTVLNSLGAVVLGTVLGATLAACSTGAPEASGSDVPVLGATADATPTPTETPVPTPTPIDGDPEVSARWAAEVFPITGTDQYVVYTNGQLAAAGESGSSVTSDTAPGSYELHVACEGDPESTITITATSNGVASSRVTAPCDETIQTVPFTMTETGVTVAVTGTGELPVRWASVLATQPLG